MLIFSAYPLNQFQNKVYFRNVFVSVFLLMVFHSANIYSFGILRAQKNNANSIQFVFSAFTDKRDSIQLDVLRFYVSSVQIYSRGKMIAADSSEFYLVDIKDSSKSSFTLRSKMSESFDEVRFCIGIDSTTSTSGAIEGDLNPSHQMYWTWQSGYIFVKLEGYVKKKQFQCHLGGYAFPNRAIQEIQFKIDPDRELRFTFDAHHFFTHIPSGIPSVVMRPGEEAKILMQHFAASMHLEK